MAFASCVSDACHVLTLFAKSFIVDNGKGYRVVCKPLARGQSFTTMCGYITKDKGRAWYQCRIHNIPREDLQQGRLHISAQTAIDDGKVILTQRNFFSEMYIFSMRSLYPCVCPVRVVAMHAHQSAAYIPALDWVRNLPRSIRMRRRHCGRQPGILNSSLWLIVTIFFLMAIPDHETEKGTS